MSDAPTPRLSCERRDNAIVVRLAAKLLEDKDLKEMERAIDEASLGGAQTVVVIDMSKIQLVPSLALGLLVQLSSKCRARQQKLKLAALSSNVRQVFLTTRLDRVLELVESVDAATA